MKRINPVCSILWEMVKRQAATDGSGNDPYQQESAYRRINGSLHRRKNKASHEDMKHSIQKSHGKKEKTVTELDDVLIFPEEDVGRDKQAKDLE